LEGGNAGIETEESGFEGIKMLIMSKKNFM